MNHFLRNQMQRTVAALALLLFGMAVTAPSVKAESHPLLEAIENVFKRSQTDDLKEYGLDNSQWLPGDFSHSIKGCWLKKGEGKIFTPRLDPNVEYAVIGGGDNSATKIKIEILNAGTHTPATEKDPVITESTEGNNMPGAVFTVPKRQNVGIRVVLEDVDENSGKESSYVAFLVMRKDSGWDVPLENIKIAAEKLQKRLDKIREANGGSADLAYRWFSIHGGIIPKGMKSANVHTLQTGKKYIIVAASDGNTDALEVTLEGIVRAPNDSETVEEEPKVTYKRGPKPLYPAGFNAMHAVRNPGDTAVVLVAIVELIEAG